MFARKGLLTRRFFLKALGAGVLLAPAGPRFGLATPLTLRAGTTAAVRLMDGSDLQTPVWGYNDAVPGPLLRSKRGGFVDVTFQNDLSQPSSIHWHGIRIANEMDGVPGLTQQPVEPGASFRYRFKTPDAGTFWYHPHLLSAEQVDRGLYGILIVEEDDPPAVDQDLLMVLDDWRLADDGRIVEDFGNFHDAAHAGRLGNTATLNSEPYLILNVAKNQRLRLRMCSTANARVMALGIEGHDLLAIAVDGQPVPPFGVDKGQVQLAPGQRVDVILDATGNVGSVSKIELFTQGERLEIGEIRYATEPARPEPLLQFQPLAENLTAQPIAVAVARKVDLVMQGGAMGRLPPNLIMGNTHAHGDDGNEPQIAWAFNGTAGMPEEPLFAAKRGEQIIVTFRNETRWPHAMHMHGHHVREVSADGTVSSIWRDTLLFNANESRQIAMVCDNPGKWMLHCHMLEHQVSGMATWFMVA